MLFWSAVIIITLYILACVVMYFNQDGQIFLPEKLPEEHQYQFDHTFEEKNYYPEEGVRINALHFKVDDPLGVLLYFHGNSGSLSNWGITGGRFTEYGYDVLVMDYRQYGKSTGSFSEEGMFRDALYIYDDLAREYGENRITIYGRSLGSGIATHTAARRDPWRLILETPYYSLVNLAFSYYPWLPHHLLLKYEFRNYRYLGEIHCPIHIFHGDKDKVVPYRASKKLMEHAKPGDELITIEGGKHSDLDHFDQFHQELRRILLKRGK